jgi:hypothetical protein
MIIIYKIISSILLLLTLINSEIIFNSSVLGYEIDMGLAYIAAGMFWFCFIVVLIIDLILKLQGYKLVLFKINYVLIFLFIIFLIINLIYNPINPTNYRYEPATWYVITELIYNIGFYGLIIVKSIYSIFFQIRK